MATAGNPEVQNSDSLLSIEFNGHFGQTAMSSNHLLFSFSHLNRSNTVSCFHIQSRFWFTLVHAHTVENIVCYDWMNDRITANSKITRNKQKTHILLLLHINEEKERGKTLRLNPFYSRFRCKHKRNIRSPVWIVIKEEEKRTLKYLTFSVWFMVIKPIMIFGNIRI